MFLIEASDLMVMEQFSTSKLCFSQLTLMSLFFLFRLFNFVTRGDCLRGNRLIELLPYIISMIYIVNDIAKGDR